MKSIPQYAFYKTKYGDELLIDVVNLKAVKKYLTENPVHTLIYYDITLISEGSGFFRIDEREYTVKPGDVVFSQPGQIRMWDKDNITDGDALIFEEEFLLTFFNDPDFLRHLSYFRPESSSRLRLDDETYARISGLIKNIKTEIDTYRVKDKHILRALLYETLMLLDRAYLKVDKPAEENPKITNRYIEKFANLVNADIKQHRDVRYYADKLCITPNHLNESVKKATGINAKQYIGNKITREAKKLLIYTDLSISEAASDLGFDDAAYFIRFFRKQTGYTPSEYRKIIKQKNP